MFASKYFCKKKFFFFNTLSKQKVKSYATNGCQKSEFLAPVPPLNVAQIYGIRYTIYNTPQNFVDLSSETLTKVCILASYF